MQKLPCIPDDYMGIWFWLWWSIGSRGVERKGLHAQMLHGSVPVEGYSIWQIQSCGENIGKFIEEDLELHRRTRWCNQGMSNKLRSGSNAMYSNWLGCFFPWLCQSTIEAQSNGVELWWEVFGVLQFTASWVPLSPRCSRLNNSKCSILILKGLANWLSCRCL